MTTEQQRIAIAEWMGRNGWWCPQCKTLVSEYSLGYQNRHQNCTESARQSPNYPEDLNAMHEAWTKLTFEQDEAYCRNLHKVCYPDNSCRRPWDCSFTINATAAQRSEALCRTLWPERFETMKGEA